MVDLHVRSVVFPVTRKHFMLVQSSKQITRTFFYASFLQGFSGMNRFNQSPWSKVQCEMILAFLSFAEYFRPRFFLLENVRNFISFNKGQTFRLTLASLLEMGYQVLAFFSLLVVLAFYHFDQH